MSTTPLETRISERLRRTVEPLKELLVEVRQERDAARVKADGLAKHARDLERTIRGIDPTFEPVSKPGPKSNHKKSTPATWRNLSESSLESLSKWLTENRERLPKVFNGKDLTDLEFYDLQRTDVAARLAVLADRGVVRLDHVGRGSVKFYAVVGPTD